MANEQRRLILGNGERYIEPITKARGGRASLPPRSYAEARARIQGDIRETLGLFEQLPDSKKLDDEAIFCLRLHPDSVAKSYSPTAIFTQVPELVEVGSRQYQADPKQVAATPSIEKKVENLSLIHI